MTTERWKYFKLHNFECKCGCGRNLIDYEFVDKLDALRKASGLMMIISSGYRCNSYNNKVSTTGLYGPHTTGHASDIFINRQQAHLLLKCAMKAGFAGIGINQKGNKRFIHLDDLPNTPGQPRPTIWSY